MILRSNQQLLLGRRGRENQGQVTLLIELGLWLEKQQIVEMLNNFRLFFSISHLCYSEAIPYILKLQQNEKRGEFGLLNFSSVLPKSSLISRFFSSHQHSQIFDLYLKFLAQGEQNPEGISYQYIEENLRIHALRVLKKRQENLKVEYFRPIRSSIIEISTFRGVFIHRKYNLNTDSYEISTPTKGVVDFAMKKNLRVSAAGEYQRIVRLFSEEKMKEIYGKGYEQFLKERDIKRYMIRLEAELLITASSKAGGERRWGGVGPTEHILQVESVFDPIYNMEEFFLTDIDFLLEGNYHLRSSLHV